MLITMRARCASDECRGRGRKELDSDRLLAGAPWKLHGVTVAQSCKDIEGVEWLAISARN